MTGVQQKEKRILLVEDEQAYRTFVLSTLRKAGFNCSFCINGDHAIKKLSQEKFDILIVDYLLPGPSGIEIVKWARKQGIDIPALLITNYPSEELHISNKTLGQTKIVAKLSLNQANMPNIVQDMLNL